MLFGKRMTPIIRASGFVGQHQGTSLRDTGCSSVVVKEQSVKKDKYTRTYGYMQMADTMHFKKSTTSENLDKHSLLHRMRWKQLAYERLCMTYT